MLRNKPKYVQQRFPTAANDPVWHWAKLFQGIAPDGVIFSDVDAHTSYRGHFLFIETKPYKVDSDVLTPARIALLEALAKEPNNSVLLVGLESAMDDNGQPDWLPVSWVWLGNPNWRKKSSVAEGGPAEFRAMLRQWFKTIDVLVDEEKRKRRATTVPVQLTLPLFPSGW